MELNVLVLAYLGDAIYELKVREYLINQGLCKVNDLQKESIKYVSAKSQSKYLETIYDLLNEEEMDIIKRARNYKRSAHPKNTDILTYKHATAFEALFGYLYKKGNLERISLILKRIFGDDYVCIW